MNDTTYQGNGKIAYVPVVVNDKQQKPTTNADRIRAKSVEEMAEFLAKVENTSAEHYIRKCGWLNWLKQEVTEE